MQQVAFVNVDLNSTKNKKLTWKEDNTVRIYDTRSKCFVFQHESVQSLDKQPGCMQIYLMCHFMNLNLLDISRKELFWETSRSPNPDNCLVLGY